MTFFPPAKELMKDNFSLKKNYKNKLVALSKTNKIELSQKKKYNLKLINI